MTQKELLSYKFGLEYSHIMLIIDEKGDEIKENPKKLDFEVHEIKLEEEHVWLEGIDWHVKLPDSVVKDIQKMKWE